jgi:predicted dinucleotide-binding enzyme
MKIAVFGTGMVGQALAGKLAELGHEVTVGSARGTEKYVALWLRLWGALGTRSLNIAVAQAPASSSS